MGFHVEQPEPGDWTLLLTPERLTGSDPYTLFVFSQNPAIDGGLGSRRSRYKQGESIPLISAGLLPAADHEPHGDRHRTPA